jgi:hypothetical protein
MGFEASPNRIRQKLVTSMGLFQRWCAIHQQVGRCGCVGLHAVAISTQLTCSEIGHAPVEAPRNFSYATVHDLHLHAGTSPFLSSLSTTIITGNASGLLQMFLTDGAAPSEAHWESHRATIQCLYLGTEGERGKSLQEVRRIMRKDHDFEAS